MNVCERIDAILVERKMSRRQLAIAADIPPSTLQSVLARGHGITFEMLMKITQALELAPQDLYPIQRGVQITGMAGDPLNGYSAIREQNKEKVISALDKLNADGQAKAVERVEELAEIPKYQKNES